MNKHINNMTRALEKQPKCSHNINLSQCPLKSSLICSLQHDIYPRLDNYDTLTLSGMLLQEKQRACQGMNRNRDQEHRIKKQA